MWGISGTFFRMKVTTKWRKVGFVVVVVVVVVVEFSFGRIQKGTCR